jgi:hypothetical protein
MNYAAIYLWSSGVLVMSWMQVAEETITRHSDGSIWFEAELGAERRNFSVRGDYCVCHAAGNGPHPVRR